MCKTKPALVNALSEYTHVEITTIYRQAWGRKNDEALFEFNIGDRVRFIGRRGVKHEGTVTKINKKRLSIDVGGFSPWLVPPTMLTKI